MHYKILDEALNKLEKYEEMDSHEIKYSRIMYERLDECNNS